VAISSVSEAYTPPGRSSGRAPRASPSNRLNFEDDLFCKALWVDGYESAPDHHSVLERKAYWLALEPQELLVRNHELPLRRYDDVHITSG